MQAGTKQEGLSHGVSLWPNCLLAPWRRGPLPRECWCLRLTWPFPKPELSPECSASSLMGPRSSLHSPSSSVSHTLPSREVSSSHVPSISPPTHMFLMCSLQSTAWRLPLVFTQPCPAATSAQDLSWTQKSLTKKPEVQGRTNDGHMYGLLISEW